MVEPLFGPNPKGSKDERGFELETSGMEVIPMRPSPSSSDSPGMRWTRRRIGVKC